MSPPVRDTDSAVPSGERRLLYEMEKLQEHMIRTFRQLQRKIAENKKSNCNMNFLRINVMLL